MSFLGDRKNRRIASDVEHQADYVAQGILSQIDTGQAPPYTVYARVPDLSPELTVKVVGRIAVSKLSEQGHELLLHALAAENVRTLVREGALISMVPGAAETPNVSA